MAVHSADQQRFAVEQQQAVANLHPAKADVPGFSFNQIFAAPQGNHGAIAVGRFRAPLPRFFHRQDQRCPFGIMAPFINWRRTWPLAPAGNQLLAVPQTDFSLQPGQLLISGGDGQIDL